MTNQYDLETFVNLDSSYKSIKADKTFSDNIKTTKGNSYSSQDEFLYNPNLISKKTNRGRKEKNKISNDQLKCEVCLELSDCSNVPTTGVVVNVFKSLIVAAPLNLMNVESASSFV